MIAQSNDTAVDCNVGSYMSIDTVWSVTQLWRGCCGVFQYRAQLFCLACPVGTYSLVGAVVSGFSRVSLKIDSRPSVDV